MLTHKPVLKVASEENISKASSILKVLNRIDSKTNLYVIEKGQPIHDYTCYLTTIRLLRLEMKKM